MVFGSISIWGLIFNDSSCFRSLPFRGCFFMIFYSFPDRALNCVNPEIIEIPLVLICYFALGTFRTRSIFRQISISCRVHFRIVFSSIFMIFSRSNLALIFQRFFMKNGFQNEAEIGVEIIQWRFWASQGAPRTHCDSFWVQFETMLKINKNSVGIGTVRKLKKTEKP